ncbi:uncharacterized protein LOC103524116 [Trichonephila clavipes]|nr:uncharacterized protein LOC103524116 [Trichonephila clavipes]
MPDLKSPSHFFRILYLIAVDLYLIVYRCLMRSPMVIKRFFRFQSPELLLEDFLKLIKRYDKCLNELLILKFDYETLDIRLDLVLNVRKRDRSPTALHAITLEIINTRFPPEEWLHIYTDGSLLDFAQGAGIGVFSHLFSQGAGIGVFSHLFSFYLHAGPLTTHFDDSTSVLQALSNYNENNCLRVQNCRELLGKIKGNIVFQWVPFHCGLWGNERADFLAKKGTASRVARDKPWSTLLTSPICVLCDTGQDMTAAHLDECSALNDLNCIVKRYWRARCLMT